MSCCEKLWLFAPPQNQFVFLTEQLLALLFSPASTDAQMHTTAFYITALNTCVEGKNPYCAILLGRHQS